MYTYVYILLYHISKTLYTYVSTYTYLCLEITIIRVSHVLYVWNRPNRYACACILSSSHHHHHHHNNNNNNKNHQVWCPPTPPRLILQRFFPKALLRSGASLAKYCLKKSKTSQHVFNVTTRHRWVGCWNNVEKNPTGNIPPKEAGVGRHELTTQFMWGKHKFIKPWDLRSVSNNQDPMEWRSRWFNSWPFWNPKLTLGLSRENSHWNWSRFHSPSQKKVTIAKLPGWQKNKLCSTWWWFQSLILRQCPQ